jgi:hypothetical protein
LISNHYSKFPGVVSVSPDRLKLLAKSFVDV